MASTGINIIFKNYLKSLSKSDKIQVGLKFLKSTGSPVLKIRLTLEIFHISGKQLVLIPKINERNNGVINDSIQTLTKVV